MTNHSQPLGSRISPFILFFLVLVGVLLYGGASSGDDTFIYMRYVANVNSGNGFTYNPGEPSFGVTSPLWAALMILPTQVFTNSVQVWSIASALLFGARALVLFFLLRRLGGTVGWAIALTLLVVCEPYTFRWGASGMENSLALFLLTSAAFVLLIEPLSLQVLNKILLGFLLALLPFTRPEFFVFSLCLLLLLTLAELGKRNPRLSNAFARYTGSIPSHSGAEPGIALNGIPVLWVSFVGFLLLAAGAVYLTFGELLPQTAAAKSIFLEQTNPLYGLQQSLVILLTGAGGLLVLVCLSLKGPLNISRLWALATLVSLVVYIFYLALNNQLVSTRYATYLSAPVVLAGAILFVQIVRPTNVTRLLLYGCLAAQLLIALGLLFYLFPATRVTEEADIKAVAAWVRSHTPANARVALSEIGVFGFYSERYVIDLVGLVDQETLEWGRKNGRPRTQRELEDLLKARQATLYIESFAQENPIGGSALTFTPLAEFPVSRNNLSRGVITPDIWRIYAISGGTRPAGSLP